LLFNISIFLAYSAVAASDNSRSYSFVAQGIGLVFLPIDPTKPKTPIVFLIAYQISSSKSQ
jgi:hypothetical protein